MQKAVVSIAEMKNNLSEYIAKSCFNHARIIITKRKRPVAALVNIKDLQLIEKNKESSGLAEAIGKWKHFNEVEKFIENVSALRKKGGIGRNVSV